MSTISTYPGFAQRRVAPAPKVRPSIRTSEGQFLAWCGEDEDVCAEWINGQVILMAADDIIHLDLNLWLAMLGRLFVDRRKIGGRVFGSGCVLRFEASEGPTRRAGSSRRVAAE